MKAENKYKKLFQNIGLFSIVNFGSKVLSFLLVPIYTHVLTASEYGTIDIYSTSINLLLPLISLSIFDAVFRFVVDNNAPDKQVAYLNSGFSFSVIVSLSVLVVSILLGLFFQKYRLFFLVLAITLIMQSFISLFQQYAKAIDCVRYYSASGLIYTFVLLSCNIIMIVILKLGVQGYYYSNLFAGLCTNTYLVIRLKLFSSLRFEFGTENELRSMLVYCLPLIPNALLWWLITASDRYVILFVCGSSANGIYAVSNKIPSIITVFTGVFFQAWQISAIQEAKSRDQTFTKRVLNLQIAGMSIGISFALILTKFLVESFVGEEFISAWRYVPFLLAAVFFQNLSSIYGTVYIVNKRTKAVLVSSLIGGTINIIGNILLIRYYGIQAASFTTMLSFAVVFLYRFFDTSRIQRIQVDNLLCFFSAVMIILQSVLFVFAYNVKLQIAILLVLVFFYVINFKRIVVRRQEEK